MKSLAVLIFLLSSTGLAHSGKSHKAHRAHGSHVHGNGTLAIAFEGNQGKVEFKSPSESILGFEHAPQSEADKKTLSDATSKMESEISKMIQLDPGSACSFSKEKIELAAEKNGKHSDFIANFQVQCQNSLAGKTMTVDFSNFPKLQNLEVTVLLGEIQKTATAKKKPIQIELK